VSIQLCGGLPAAFTHGMAEEQLHRMSSKLPGMACTVDGLLIVTISVAQLHIPSVPLAAGSS